MDDNYKDEVQKDVADEHHSRQPVANDVLKRPFVCHCRVGCSDGASMNASCECNKTVKSFCFNADQSTLHGAAAPVACIPGAQAQDVSCSKDLLAMSPMSVVLKILGYLSMRDLVHSVSMVSKTWHGIVYDEAVWNLIDLHNYYVNDATLAKIVTLCGFIKVIRLPDSRNTNITDDGIISVAHGCPHLRSFIASRSGSSFGDAGFIAMTKKCKELWRMSLDSLHITDRVLSSIAVHLHKLKYLSLCQVSAITNEGVAEVIKGCASLKTLTLNQNHQITDACFVGISDNGCILERLELMMCSINFTGVPLLGRLLYLEHLNLSQCVGLTEEHLMPVLQNCRNLCLLSLNLNKLVDDRCVETIVDHLTELSQIYLVSTAITDEALATLGRRGKNLTRVDVGYTRVTVEGVRNISELCFTLQYLGLMRCDLIAEESIEDLAQMHPNITYSTFLQDTKRLLKRAKSDVPPPTS